MIAFDQLIYLIICMVFLAHIIANRRLETMWIVRGGISLIALLLSPVVCVFDDDCVLAWKGSHSPEGCSIH